MPPMYLARFLVHSASTKSMSERLDARQWDSHGGKEVLQELFSMSQQGFTYCGCWVFSAEINLETGVFRANYFHMNSDLLLMSEVKTSKIFIAHWLAGYNLQPPFYKQLFIADLLDNLASCDSPFCFLSFILSAVSMVIKPYSGSKTSGWRRKGGERYFSIWPVLLLLQVHYLHFILVVIN